MMEFIIIPIVVGIIVSGIYGLFELFVRRKERMALIEKLSNNPDTLILEGKLNLPRYGVPKFSFSSLKIGALMFGIGLGLLVAFIISTTLFINSDIYADSWYRHNISPIIYGASVLLFGGLGLLIAFVIEMKLARKE